MNRRRTLVRVAAWAAWAATLLAALAPALSHALATRSGSAWSVVCSAQGAQRLAGDADPAGSDPASLRAPCGYCTAPALDAALPPVEAAWQAPSPGPDRPPCLERREAPERRPWAAGQPRAPPVRT